MKPYDQMSREELIQELARHQKLLAGETSENPRNTWLKLFIYLAPVSIAMFDRDMRYISASRRWGEAHHVGDRDLTGLSHYEMFPEIGEEWKDAHRRGLVGEVLRSACDRFDRLDGSVQWIRWEIQPWYETSDTVGGIVIFAEDVSELKEAQDGLEQANDRLEVKVRERTAELELALGELQSFCYSVSHDLRAPLRHINSFSSLLMDTCAGQLPETARVYLERICAASGRMGDLIDNLLKLSRVTRAELHREVVDLSKIAASILRAKCDAEPARTVEIVVKPGLTATGDRTLLQQLLENLLENAWKYTSKNPAARIEWGMTIQDGKEVYFIGDNGVGFDMRYQKKLFKAFECLHTAEFEGMGIGLAIAKKIIERHGGTIRAEGEVGKGSTFFFTLSGA
jgi:PAS domain S-box-containing protein